MRIDELRLRAWGPFSNTTIDMSAGHHGLHLVVGANEAGKSSALRAITALLYGIPSQCGDAFFHGNPVLRVGAVLRRSDGETLSIVRRKGTKNTLLDSNDQPIPEATLGAWLGGMGADLFKALFGVSHETLRQGGEDLLKGHGHLGQAIVAASAGYRDLKGVLEALESEAETLFKSGRGKQPVINQAILSLKAARDEISQATVRWSKYDEAVKVVAKREAERDQIVEELVRLRAEHGRLERIREAIPLIAENRSTLARIEKLGEVVTLPDDFASNRMLVQQRLKASRAAELRAQTELTEIENSLKDLVVPAGLLEQEAAISHLFQRLGTHHKALSELPSLETQLGQVERDALEILKDLGRPASLDQIDALRLPLHVQVRIQELTSKHQALQERLETAAEMVADLSAEIEAASRDREALGPSADVSELRAVLAGAQEDGDLDRTRARAARQLEEEEAQARADVKKLGLWNGCLDELETLPIPSDKTTDYFDTELTSIENELRTRAELLHQALAEDSNIDGKLRALQMTGAVPTEQELMSLREMRDDGWRRLRTAWQGGGAYDPEDAEAYERILKKADDCADRLRRESERVIEMANLLAAKAHNEQLVAGVRAQITEIELKKTELFRQWSATWASAGITPLRPPEMRSWVQKHGRLAEQVRAIRSHRRELEEIDHKIRSTRERMTAALRKVNEVGDSDSDAKEIGPILRKARAIIDRNDRIEREGEQLATHIKQQEQKRAKTQARVEAAREALQTWQVAWTKTVMDAGLTLDTSPAEASAIVVKTLELVKKADEAIGYRQRIQDIKRELDAFEQAVAYLVERIAPDLSQLPAAQAVAALDVRLKEASRNRARGEELEKGRRERTELLHASRMTIQQCQDELGEMCRRAGCTNADELPDAEQRSAELGRLRQQLATLELQLRPLAAGMELAQFIAEAERENADTLPALLEEAGRRMDEAETRRKAIEQEIGARKADLGRIRGGSEAADAAETAQSIAARIRDATERYLRVRLAAAILHREIDIYRREHQEPVMKRAGEIFCRLTAGSFRSLRVGYDSADEPIIVGVRAADRRAMPGVPGTADGGPAADPLRAAAGAAAPGAAGTAAPGAAGAAGTAAPGVAGTAAPGAAGAAGTAAPGVAGTVDGGPAADRARAADEEVRVDGMSDGTRDQLYLSLRLASIEGYLDRNEAMPLIVDDILVHFDDRRAAAALEVLGDLSRRTQVIVFTHHPHLVDVAQRTAAADVVCAHTLRG